MKTLLIALLALLAVAVHASQQPVDNLDDHDLILHPPEGWHAVTDRAPEGPARDGIAYRVRTNTSERRTYCCRWGSSAGDGKVPRPDLGVKPVNKPELGVAWQPLRLLLVFVVRLVSASVAHNIPKHGYKSVEQFF